MADSTKAARGADDRRTLAGGLVLQSSQMRVDTGQPQLYGTDRELGPRPIEDPQRLDERRAQAGLELFADYETRMRTRT